MFEGVRGVNIAGDIAIDDVSLSNGLCSGMYAFFVRFLVFDSSIIDPIKKNRFDDK